MPSNSTALSATFAFPSSTDCAFTVASSYPFQVSEFKRAVEANCISSWSVENVVLHRTSFIVIA